MFIQYSVNRDAMSSDTKPSRVTLSLGLIAILAFAMLIWAFYSGKSNDKLANPDQAKPSSDIGEEVSADENLIANNPTILSSHDRLAVLESFSSLDRLVVDRCYAPVALNPKQFEDSEERSKLAQKFQSEINSYQSLEKLEAFSLAVGQLLRLEKAPDDIALHSHLKKFRKFQGSGPILDGDRDPNLLAAFQYITTQRRDQLRAHKQIKNLKTAFEEDWKQQFKQWGIEIQLPENLPSGDDIKIQYVLRYWELSGTRFLLAISGNKVITKQVREIYPGKIRPIYIQALNAVLDSAQRRFRTVATYQPQMASNPNGLFENVDGQIALVEFAGAIPRAKLFSDWQQGVSADTANDILYSPGFNPHAKILLRQDGLHQPERPAATINLPPVKIESIKNSRAVLKAPALDHNSVLMLNDQFDPDWTVTIDGQTAEILRANNNARAVYLEPSKTVRTICFTYRHSRR